MFERLITLIGEDDVNKLKKANVLIVGLGGVGGYALETLVRSGIYNLTIVDGDIVELSNLNRQIISKRGVIGRPKALVAQARTLEINPDVNLKVINQFISEDKFSLLNIDSFDYVIDACDDLNLKMLLIKNADKYKLISSMGTANKMDITRFSQMHTELSDMQLVQAFSIYHNEPKPFEALDFHKNYRIPRMHSSPYLCSCIY